MFPTPPELREDFTFGDQCNRTTGLQTHTGPAVVSDQCPCGCSMSEDKNVPNTKRFKIIAGLTLASMIAMVGLNAYHRDSVEAANSTQTRVQPIAYSTPAGSIQAAETTFPTLVPINEMPRYRQVGNIPYSQFQYPSQSQMQYSVPQHYAMQQTPLQHYAHATQMPEQVYYSGIVPNVDGKPVLKRVVTR